MAQLTVDPDQFAEFLAAVLSRLAGPQTKAAFWFYEPANLPITAEPISAASPFANSGSILAGHGCLVRLTKTNAAILAAFFGASLDTLSTLLHLEVERDGRLQFQSYDYFTVNLTGPDLDEQ